MILRPRRTERHRPAVATSLAQRSPPASRLNPLAATGVLAWAILAPLPLIEIETFTEKHPVRQAAIDFVQQTTAPADCIISKENRLHFLAGRLSTPHLSLISTARLFSGLLPAAAIAAEIAHDCLSCLHRHLRPANPRSCRSWTALCPCLRWSTCGVDGPLKPCGQNDVLAARRAGILAGRPHCVPRLRVECRAVAWARCNLHWQAVEQIPRICNLRSQDARQCKCHLRPLSFHVMATTRCRCRVERIAHGSRCASAYYPATGMILPAVVAWRDARRDCRPARDLPPEMRLGPYDGAGTPGLSPAPDGPRPTRSPLARSGYGD